MMSSGKALNEPAHSRGLLDSGGLSSAINCARVDGFFTLAFPTPRPDLVVPGALASTLERNWLPAQVPPRVQTGRIRWLRSRGRIARRCLAHGARDLGSGPIWSECPSLTTLALSSGSHGIFVSLAAALIAKAAKFRSRLV